VPRAGPDSRPLYTGPMGAWYTIGLCLGLGLGLGVIVAGLLAVNALGTGVAALGAAAVGAAVGFFLGDVPEAVAGGLAGLVGALSAALLVKGALRRGATRIGLAAYLGAAGLLVALLALIPALGYFLALAVPALAARMRSRQAARFAGLRTLAR
jgi:hypothetical protein